MVIGDRFFHYTSNQNGSAQGAESSFQLSSLTRVLHTSPEIPEVGNKVFFANSHQGIVTSVNETAGTFVARIVSAPDLSMFVRWDARQTLTDAQRSVGAENIRAVSGFSVRSWDNLGFALNLNSNQAGVLPGQTRITRTPIQNGPPGTENPEHRGVYDLIETWGDNDDFRPGVTDIEGGRRHQQLRIFRHDNPVVRGTWWHRFEIEGDWTLWERIGGS